MKIKITISANDLGEVAVLSRQIADLIESQIVPNADKNMLAPVCPMEGTVLAPNGYAKWERMTDGSI